MRGKPLTKLDVPRGAVLSRFESSARVAAVVTLRFGSSRRSSKTRRLGEITRPAPERHRLAMPGSPTANAMHSTM
eukprot:4892605-Alexandrium_andersonii.AAC.1